MLDGTKTGLALASLGCLLVVTAARTAGAQTQIAVAPKGEYAQIDTRLATATIQVLAQGTTAEKRQAIESIKASPDRYAPPVFYLLSKVLFEDGKEDEGAFWFYAGQLRARFDANRCADISAREAVAVLDQQFGSPINQFMFKRLTQLEELVPRVVEWDRKTPYNYDHRWINLHGMDAMISGLDADSSGGKPASLSLPREQWNEIAEKTRADYLAGFRAAIVRIKQPRPRRR